MIYPENFPEDRKQERAELKVFDRLKKISEKYDVFYSRKFVSDGVGTLTMLLRLQIWY